MPDEGLGPGEVITFLMGTTDINNKFPLYVSYVNHLGPRRTTDIQMIALIAPNGLQTYS